MSDTHVKLISEDVNFQAEDLKIEQALTYLSSIFPTHIVKQQFDNIQFVDQGGVKQWIQPGRHLLKI